MDVCHLVGTMIVVMTFCDDTVELMFPVELLYMAEIETSDYHGLLLVVTGVSC
jgi:hypothetical protein